MKKLLSPVKHINIIQYNIANTNLPVHGYQLMLKRLVLLIFSLTLLTSCGFKLRGNFEMSPALSQITIEGGDRELVDQVSELLELSGSTVVDTGTDAATLVITKSEYKREVRAKDANGIATGYNYQYSIDYNVTDAEGESLQSTASISQLRTLNYEAGNELEVEEEEAFLREEMEKEIALQIMRRLSRI